MSAAKTKKPPSVRKSPPDFSAAVRERTAKAASYFCSRPECRASTTAAKTEDDLEKIGVGDAAHIHAARKGQKRYLETMSDEERAAPDNAIWLCGTCHRVVDSDDKLYPAEVLRAWKALAEHEVRINLGKPRDPPVVERVRVSIEQGPVSDLTFTGFVFNYGLSPVLITNWVARFTFSSAFWHENGREPKPLQSFRGADLATVQPFPSRVLYPENEPLTMTIKVDMARVLNQYVYVMDRNSPQIPSYWVDIELSLTVDSVGASRVATRGTIYGRGQRPEFDS